MTYLILWLSGSVIFVAGMWLGAAFCRGREHDAYRSGHSAGYIVGFSDGQGSVMFTTSAADKEDA